MLELIVSPEAEQDLIEIWLYIAADSALNADRFLSRLNEKAQWLTEYSQAGLNRDELAPGLRSFPVDRYQLYYRDQDGCLDLVRVLSGSRDIYLIF